MRRNRPLVSHLAAFVYPEVPLLNLFSTLLYYLPGHHHGTNSQKLQTPNPLKNEEYRDCKKMIHHSSRNLRFHQFIPSNFGSKLLSIILQAINSLSTADTNCPRERASYLSSTVNYTNCSCNNCKFKKRRSTTAFKIHTHGAACDCLASTNCLFWLCA